MSSSWVRTEILTARKREVQEQRRILFPITLVPYESLRDWRCFDVDSGEDAAIVVREYFILDFTQWHQYEHYMPSLEKLLHDLVPDPAGGS